METNQEITDLLGRPETKLKQRIPRIEARSSESLLDELEALELVIVLRRKLD